MSGAQNSAEPPKAFTFDQVYDDSTQQEVLYTQTASRIVEAPRWLSMFRESAP